MASRADEEKASLEGVGEKTHEEQNGPDGEGHWQVADLSRDPGSH